MEEKLKAVFMGTSGIGIPVLQSMHEDPKVSLELVVSMPDRPKGRGRTLCSPDVVLWAQENHVEIHQSEKINHDPLLWTKLLSLRPDLIVVFAFSQFLSKKILQLPKRGCFNIHTSLLPKYRGAAPITYALLNGDQETGISIQRMASRMDAGDVVSSKSLKIDERETGESLYKKLMDMTPSVWTEFQRDLAKGTLKAVPQKEEEATFAPLLRKSDGLLNFKEMSPLEIDRRVRAFWPWPGAYTYLNGLRLKVLEVQKIDRPLPPGSASQEMKMLCVGCLGGSVRLLRLQKAGGSPCSDVDILNGLQNQERPLSLGPQEERMP